MDRTFFKTCDQDQFCQKMDHKTNKGRAELNRIALNSELKINECRKSDTGYLSPLKRKPGYLKRNHEKAEK